MILNARNSGVDFVVRFRGKLFAMEAKSGSRSRKISAQTEFLKHNLKAKPLIVGTVGMPLEKFFTRSIEQL